MTGDTLTRTPTGSGGERRLLGLSVRVLAGPDRGREARLERGTCVLGTRDDCDLVLHDPTVSRRHASVELMGAKVRVRDLGSKNGTRFLGERIESVEVAVGSIVKLGGSLIALLPLERKGTPEDRAGLGGLVGGSPPMRELYAQLERVAPTDTPVLVIGETGTGKELVARALHALSLRARGRMQVFDCGSVQPDLLQSALFGHVKGSFTGAVQNASGAVELADGGTLFLDEIGELPSATQATFLRVLETHRYQRLGDRAERVSDFRLVCATNRDLEADAREGKFRQDLYYRIAALTLRVPPLRERRDDVASIAEHIAAEVGAPRPVPPAALAMLSSYRWPGNVRELRNLVSRAAAVDWPAALATIDASTCEGEGLDFHEARERAIKSFEKSYLEALLARCKGSASAAARSAGLARSYFYRLLAEHGIDPATHKRR